MPMVVGSCVLQPAQNMGCLVFEGSPKQTHTHIEYFAFTRAIARRIMLDLLYYRWSLLWNFFS